MVQWYNAGVCHSQYTNHFTINAHDVDKALWRGIE